MITMNELFSGVGSQKMGQDRLGVECEVVCTAEINKEATISYAAIHCKLKEMEESIPPFMLPSPEKMADYLYARNIGYNFKTNKSYDWQKMADSKSTNQQKLLKRYFLASKLSKNAGDISRIVRLPEADFWTYSFPCQDISVAGKQAGIEKNTRSGLLYQVERLLEIAAKEDTLPKYLMLENVKNLVGKKFKAQFDEWLEKLDSLGYNTYWQVLNAKNYGVPQNRERVFAISIRKDIDTGYSFPEPLDNGTRIKDILEKEVDEKYYLSEKIQERLILNNKQRANNKIHKVGNTNPSGHGMNGDVFSQDGLAPTITTNKGEGNKILIKQIGNIVHTGNFKNPQRGRIYSAKGCSPALNCCGGGGLEPKILIKQATKEGYVLEPTYRIRKLTPLECWRLMGFTDEDFYKAQEYMSNSALYKQAGNSIVVDVLYHIFKQLFKEEER